MTDASVKITTKKRKNDHKEKKDFIYIYICEVNAIASKKTNLPSQVAEADVEFVLLTRLTAAVRRTPV